jgi:hypothetical protein
MGDTIVHPSQDVRRLQYQLGDVLLSCHVTAEGTWEQLFECTMMKA